MIPTELKKLPEPQQRNALLAIALGYPVAQKYTIIDNPTDFTSKVPVYILEWKPEQDGALMWRLVCELRSVVGSIGELWDYTESEKDLIIAYTDYDPKGLIAKWRKENEQHTNAAQTCSTNQGVGRSYS